MQLEPEAGGKGHQEAGVMALGLVRLPNDYEVLRSQSRGTVKQQTRPGQLRATICIIGSWCLD